MDTVVGPGSVLLVSGCVTVEVVSLLGKWPCVTASSTVGEVMGGAMFVSTDVVRVAESAYIVLSAPDDSFRTDDV